MRIARANGIPDGVAFAENPLDVAGERLELLDLRAPVEPEVDVCVALRVDLRSLTRIVAAVAKAPTAKAAK